MTLFPEDETLAERALRDLGDEELLDDPEVWSALRAELPTSAERLLASARDASLHPKWRLHAALFLVHLEHGDADRALVSAIETGEPSARATVLELLWRAWTFASDALRADLAASDELRAALDRTLDEADLTLRARAVPLAARMSVTRLAERLVPLLDTEDVAARYVAAVHLLEGDHPQSVDALCEHLASWDGSTPAPSQQDTARFVALASAESMATVRHLFAVSRDPHVRGHCLLAAARLGSTDDELEPRAFLNDPRLGPWAASALGRRHRGSGDPRVIASLEPVLSICAASERRRVLEAILDIGGTEADLVADRIVSTVAPELKALRAARKGFGPERFLQRAVELGILDAEPDPEALRAAREYWGADADPVVIVLHVLDDQGTLAFFGAEHDSIPVPHDELVRLFGEKSGGRFQPQDVRQTWNRTGPDDDEAGYTVEFRHGDRDWSFEAENHRDWFDVLSVVRAVNAALEASGAEERFLAFDEAWLCARPEAAHALGEELGVRVGS